MDGESQHGEKKVEVPHQNKELKDTPSQIPPGHKDIIDELTKISSPDSAFQKLATIPINNKYDSRFLFRYSPNPPEPHQPPLEKFDFVNIEAPQTPTEEILKEAIKAVEQNPQDIPSTVTDKQGHIYSLKDTTGSHVKVYIAQADSTDVPDFVIRQSAEDGRTALQVMKNHPTAKKYLPNTFAISDSHNWTVMERVTGIEGNVLKAKLQEDPELLEKYAQAFAKVVIDSSQDGLYLADVWWGGQNVIVNPQTGTLRFIEQRNLREDPHVSASELAANFVFENLDSMHSQTTNARDDMKLQTQEHFMFAFLKECARHVDLQRLFLRSNRYAATHPAYPYRYATPPEELNPENNGSPVPQPFTEHLLTRILSKELIKAIKENNFTQFSSLLKTNKFFEEVADNTDPRSAPHILA